MGGGCGQLTMMITHPHPQDMRAEKTRGKQQQLERRSSHGIYSVNGMTGFDLKCLLMKESHF